MPSNARVLPSSVPSGVDGMFQRSGASVAHDSGRRFSNASMQASTHSEIGTALRPRELVSTQSGPISSTGNRSMPVPIRCTQRTPRDSTSARLGTAVGVEIRTSPVSPSGSSPSEGIGTTSTRAARSGGEVDRLEAADVAEDAEHGSDATTPSRAAAAG